MHSVNVSSTRNYGKVSHTIGVVVPHDGEPGSLARAYDEANQQVAALFEDWETHHLPKIQYKAAEQGGGASAIAPTEWIDIVEIMKEVKDGKESIRLRTKPGTYFNKFGVSVYPECENYDLILKALGTGYAYKAQSGDNMRARIQTEGSKKAVAFMMDIVAF